MPTYQYACTECGTPLEVVQSFAEPPLTECPTCGGRLRKVFSAVGVVFKGSGFYRTDSRSDGAKATSKSDGAGVKADGGKDSSSSKDSDSRKSDSAGGKNDTAAKMDGVARTTEKGAAAAKAPVSTGSGGSSSAG